MKRVILWFRQDLRLHDNRALVDAMAVADEILPIYVFDPRQFQGKTEFGFDRIGEMRARFIRESVVALRERIRESGSELVVRVGPPEEVILEIANKAKSSWVFCNRERTQPDVDIQDALERNLWTIGQEMRYSRGKMLYHTADLPFPITHTPDNFVTFRKETERLVPIREAILPPDKLPGFSVSVDLGAMPKLSELLGRNASDINGSGEIRGGETKALERLRILKQELIDTPDDDDGGMKMMEPRLSPWLSQGCLSPKRVYALLDMPEFRRSALAERMVNDLYYRDYLRLMVKKHGQAIFQPAGLSDQPVREESGFEDKLRLWKDGITGIPIIDAGMRQLNSTGFISNKMRNLLALFLIYELEISWRVGASYFESRLIDYDPCSNWTNWCNLAGVGPSAKEYRGLNYVLQAKRIDPQGDYVRHWIPELKNAEDQWIHQPDQADDSARNDAGICLGKDYPKAIFSTERWHSLS